MKNEHEMIICPCCDAEHDECELCEGAHLVTVIEAAIWDEKQLMQLEEERRALQEAYTDWEEQRRFAYT